MIVIMLLLIYAEESASRIWPLGIKTEVLILRALQPEKHFHPLPTNINPCTLHLLASKLQTKLFIKSFWETPKLGTENKSSYWLE